MRDRLREQPFKKFLSMATRWREEPIELGCSAPNRSLWRIIGKLPLGRWNREEKQRGWIEGQEVEVFTSKELWEVTVVLSLETSSPLSSRCFSSHLLPLF